MLTMANYKQKFDEVEEANRQNPGMSPSALEQILGPGEAVTAAHPDIANGPPGVGRDVEKWSRWERGHEVLFVGYIQDHASSVVRFRR